MIVDVPSKPAVQALSSYGLSQKGKTGLDRLRENKFIACEISVLENAITMFFFFKIHFILLTRCGVIWLGQYLKPIWQDMRNIYPLAMCLKVDILRLQPFLQGTNALNKFATLWVTNIRFFFADIQWFVWEVYMLEYFELRLRISCCFISSC